MRGLLGKQTAGGARRQALTQHAAAHLRPRNLGGAAGAHGPRPSGRGSVAVAAVEWRRLVALALGLSLELDAIRVGRKGSFRQITKSIIPFKTNRSRWSETGAELVEKSLERVVGRENLKAGMFDAGSREQSGAHIGADKAKLTLHR